MTGYIMIRKNRLGRRWGGVILYIKESIQAKNKIATECLNILKSEIDCVVDKFVPLKNQGKRSKKKHLSKEPIRKIKYK